MNISLEAKPPAWPEDFGLAGFGTPGSREQAQAMVLVIFT
jgi:hypothetical protein